MKINEVTEGSGDLKDLGPEVLDEYFADDVSTINGPESDNYHQSVTLGTLSTLDYGLPMQGIGLVTEAYGMLLSHATRQSQRHVSRSCHEGFNG